MTTTETACTQIVPNRNGQCLNATRHCASPVHYVDALGRPWCARHEPDEERKAAITRNAEVSASKRAILTFSSEVA
jgi:hypothetical protein